MSQFEQQIVDLLDPELSHLNPHPIYEYSDDPNYISTLLAIIENNLIDVARQQLAAILIQQTKKYKIIEVLKILELTIMNQHNSIREYFVKGLQSYCRSQWYNIPNFFDILMNNVQRN